MAYRDSTSNSGSATSLVVTAPTGIQDGDILIASWINGGSDSSTITWPSGFAELAADGDTTSPNSATFKSAWKRASSESGNYTISSSTNDFCAAAISVYSGRHASDNPVSVATVDNNSNPSPLSAAATGVTAVEGDDIVYLMVQNDGGGQWAHTPPTNYTEREEASPGSWVSLSLSDRENVSAGATGTLTGTLTLAESSGGWSVIVIRIPAAAGGTVNTQTLTSTLAIADAGLTSKTSGRVSSEALSIEDAGLDYVFYSRLGSDSVTVTEGALESFTVHGVVAISEVDISDGIIAWMLRNRLLEDNVLVTDELISSVIGYLIYSSILTSNVSVTDQALTELDLHRLLESNLATEDQLFRALLLARDLLDGVNVADSALTSVQRFILLTDTLSLEDSLVSTYVPETKVNPIIRIGFDQPDVTLGGYSVN